MNGNSFQSLLFKFGKQPDKQEINIGTFGG
jgi:hypothetical protein